jgi:peptidoglycan/LPS O-acetylase OafA/YrhL
MLYAGADETGVLKNLFRLDGVPLWSYATYTQNIFMGIHSSAGAGWLGVTWSLAVEEQFYLVLPLLVYYISEKRLPYIFLWIVLTAIYLRFTMPGLSAYINTPWRADSLMIGSLLAYYIRIPAFVSYVETRRVYLLGLLVIITTGLFVANNYGRLSLGGAVTHITLAILFGLFILYVIIYREGMLARLMRSRVLMWLGSISYGVYLFHTNISKIVHGLIRQAHPQIATWSEAMITLFALVLTLLLAQISYRYFEKRIVVFGHKHKYE